MIEVETEIGHRQRSPKDHGWTRYDYAAAGLPFPQTAPRIDEGSCAHCWTTPGEEHHAGCLQHPDREAVLADLEVREYVLPDRDLGGIGDNHSAAI